MLRHCPNVNAFSILNVYKPSRVVCCYNIGNTLSKIYTHDKYIKVVLVFTRYIWHYMSFSLKKNNAAAELISAYRHIKSWNLRTYQFFERVYNFPVEYFNNLVPGHGGAHGEALGNGIWSYLTTNNSGLCYKLYPPKKVCLPGKPCN